MFTDTPGLATTRKIFRLALLRVSDIGARPTWRGAVLPGCWLLDEATRQVIFPWPSTANGVSGRRESCGAIRCVPIRPPKVVRKCGSPRCALG